MSKSKSRVRVLPIRRPKYAAFEVERIRASSILTPIQSSPISQLARSATANLYACRRQPAEPEPVRGLSVAVRGLGEGLTVKNKLVNPIVAPMESLDELDFHLLRELIVGSGAYLRSDRVSLEAVGRAVGVHRSTVADRLAKWGRIGFLTDWTIDVDPGALGLVGAHVHFHSRAQALHRALELASLVEGVEGVLAFDQGWVGIIFMADSLDALKRTEMLLAEILEADRTTRMVDTAVDYPDSRLVPLSPLDGKLLTALIRDSRQTPTVLAKKLHVTVRTVERRLERLRNEEVHYIRPLFHFAGVRGVTFALLCFSYAAREREAALGAILERITNLVVRQVEAPTRGMLGTYGSARELDDSAKAVASIPGVKDVRLRILLGEVDPPGFAAWVSERIVRRSEAH